MAYLEPDGDPRERLQQERRLECNAVTREKGSPLLLMRSELPLGALKCHGCATNATACVSSCSARVASLLSLSLLCHRAAKDSEKIQSERLHPSMRSPAPCQTRQKGGPEYGMMRVDVGHNQRAKRVSGHCAGANLNHGCKGGKQATRARTEKRTVAHLLPCLPGFQRLDPLKWRGGLQQRPGVRLLPQSLLLLQPQGSCRPAWQRPAGTGAGSAGEAPGLIW